MRRTTLRNIASNCLIQVASATSAAAPGGGPPVLRTNTSACCSTSCRAFDGGWIGEVADTGRDFSSACDSLGCERAQPLTIARDGDDVRAFARKTPRDCPTQPPRGARHQSVAIFKSQVHGISPSASPSGVSPSAQGNRWLPAGYSLYRAPAGFCSRWGWMPPQPHKTLPSTVKSMITRGPCRSTVCGQHGNGISGLKIALDGAPRRDFEGDVHRMANK